MIKLPPQVKRIINILEKNGFDAYCVGGCVRDALLGKTPHDWDICSDALPAEVKECFAGHNFIESGLKHGTLGVIVNKGVYQITTYRTEGPYLDLRRPDSVSFIKDLKTDLSRRDFTINAMAYSEKTGLKDFFCGESDLKNKIIRCVGDPDKRLFEDPLRILRALRFSSQLGFDIEKDTRAALFKHKDALLGIAPERVNFELSGIVLGRFAGETVGCFADIINVILPDVRLSYNVLKILKDAPPDIEVRLAILLKGAGDVKAILKRLRFDNKTIKQVCALLSNYGVEITLSRRDIKMKLKNLGEKTLRQLLAIKAVDKSAEFEGPDFFIKANGLLNEIIEQKQCYSLKGLAVDGNDLTRLGLKGRQIGKGLNLLLEMVISEELENEKAKLLNYIANNAQAIV